jgi:hypothetical protein
MAIFTRQCRFLSRVRISYRRCERGFRLNLYQRQRSSYLQFCTSEVRISRTPSPRLNLRVPRVLYISFNEDAPDSRKISRTRPRLHCIALHRVAFFCSRAARRTLRLKDRPAATRNGPSGPVNRAGGYKAIRAHMDHSPFKLGDE